MGGDGQVSYPIFSEDERNISRRRWRISQAVAVEEAVILVYTSYKDSLLLPRLIEGITSFVSSMTWGPNILVASSSRAQLDLLREILCKIHTESCWIRQRSRRVFHTLTVSVTKPTIWQSPGNSQIYMGTGSTFPTIAKTKLLVAVPNVGELVLRPETSFIHCMSPIGIPRVVGQFQIGFKKPSHGANE